MDISILLVWIAGTAIVLDGIIYMFTYRYRKYGGHIIGAMAYIILLADILLYIDKGYTDSFRHLLMGTIVVGALFVVEYIANIFRHVRMHERDFSNKIQIDNLEEEILQLRNQLNKTEAANERYRKVIDEQVEKSHILQHARETRIISNEEYEDMLPEEAEVEETREAYQLYSFLVRGYEGERGPKHERRLHNICEKICSCLDAGELKALMQVDEEYTTAAGKLYDKI